jgi:hypothetical protein
MRKRDVAFGLWIFLHVSANFVLLKVKGEIKFRRAEGKYQQNMTMSFF